MIPGLLASKAYNLIKDFGDFNVTILIFVAFFCVIPLAELVFQSSWWWCAKSCLYFKDDDDAGWVLACVESLQLDYSDHRGDRVSANRLVWSYPQLHPRHYTHHHKHFQQGKVTNTNTNTQTKAKFFDIFIVWPITGEKWITEVVLTWSPDGLRCLCTPAILTSLKKVKAVEATISKLNWGNEK